MHADDRGAARGTAHEIAALSRAAVERRGVAHVAFSGGSNALLLFGALRDEDVPWPKVHVYQVDERVAPEGHEDRNATVLRRELLEQVPVAARNVHLLPVDDDDPDALDEAAARYGSSLPRLDVAHMGIGDDGHTASWPPGDPVVTVRHQPVAVVGPFNGRVRMTLTPGTIDKAHDVVFYVTGADKHGALVRMLAGDRDLPASHVPSERAVVHCDRAAYGNGG